MNDDVTSWILALVMVSVPVIGFYGCEKEFASRKYAEDNKVSQQIFEAKSRRQDSRSAWVAECLKNSKIEGYDEKGRMMFSGPPCEEWADRAWK